MGVATYKQNYAKRICLHIWTKIREDSIIILMILEVMSTKCVRRTNTNLSKSNFLQNL